MSGSAGVMSSQVANPAKPAPTLAMSPIAAAGTSFARSTPNRSTKLIRKYLMPSCFAICARSFAIRAVLPSFRSNFFQVCLPGIQSVPASGTPAMAAASTVSAARSSGSRFKTCDLPQARAKVWVSSTSVVR